jgi:hypothetical protein
MSFVILFHFLCAQHVSDINISIIRSLRLFLLKNHIGLVVLGSMCVGVSVWLGWSGNRVAGFSLQHGYPASQYIYRFADRASQYIYLSN